MTELDNLKPLIELLATTTAIWEPIRTWQPNTLAAVVCERRRAYRRRGVPIHLVATSAARQRALRSLPIVTSNLPLSR